MAFEISELISSLKALKGTSEIIETELKMLSIQEKSGTLNEKNKQQMIDFNFAQKRIDETIANCGYLLKENSDKLHELLHDIISSSGYSMWPYGKI